MKKKHINYLFTVLIIIFLLYILYKLYNKLKEGFQVPITCDTYCGAGSICIRNNEGPSACIKLTYTSTNTCVPIRSYQSAFIYNPTNNFIQTPKRKDGGTNKICINYKMPISSDLAVLRRSQKPEHIAKCNLAGEIPVEYINTRGNNLKLFKYDGNGNIMKDRNGNDIVLGDMINCYRLQPTRTGRCIITPTAFTNGFFGTYLNPSTSTVKDSRANTNICISGRFPYNI